MNSCSYKLRPKCFIGLRVRVSSDKNTVPYDNIPVTDVKIAAWSDQGFRLQHPHFPKDIWVDFYQLPINNVIIEYGIIKTPIVFVEQVMSGGTMVLIPADSLDYIELKRDAQEVAAIESVTISKVKVGQTVRSLICPKSIKMVYLGYRELHSAGLRFADASGRPNMQESVPSGMLLTYNRKGLTKRYLFLQEYENKFTIVDYARGHKYIKDLVIEDPTIKYTESDVEDMFDQIHRDNFSTYGPELNTKYNYMDVHKVGYQEYGTRNGDFTLWPDTERAIRIRRLYNCTSNLLYSCPVSTKDSFNDFRKYIRKLSNDFKLNHDCRLLVITTDQLEGLLYDHTSRSWYSYDTIKIAREYSDIRKAKSLYTELYEKQLIETSE